MVSLTVLPGTQAIVWFDVSEVVPANFQAPPHYYE